MDLTKKCNKKYFINIAIVILLFIAIAYSYFYNTNSREGLKDMYIDTNLSTDFAKSFCKNKQQSGDELQASCGKLTQTNCRSTSCCIWTSNDKCDAGDKDGPLFSTDTSGKKNPLEYYYFNNTCYGKKCPQN